MTNPLLQITNLPNHAPAFDQIKNEHYLPALEEAIKEARLNIEAIKNNPDSPNFENTKVISLRPEILIFGFDQIS